MARDAVLFAMGARLDMLVDGLGDRDRSNMPLLYRICCEIRTLADSADLLHRASGNRPYLDEDWLVEDDEPALQPA